MGKPWEKNGKNTGNHRKTMGKTRETMRKNIGKHGKP